MAIPRINCDNAPAAGRQQIFTCTLLRSCSESVAQNPPLARSTGTGHASEGTFPDVASQPRRGAGARAGAGRVVDYRRTAKASRMLTLHRWPTTSASVWGIVEPAGDPSDPSDGVMVLFVRVKRRRHVSVRCGSLTLRASGRDATQSLAKQYIRYESRPFCRSRYICEPGAPENRRPKGRRKEGRC